MELNRFEDKPAMDSDDESGRSLLRPSQKDVVAVRLCMSYRLLMTFISMISLMLCFAYQSSMGSTMICMAVDTTSNNTDPILNNSTNNNTNGIDVTTLFTSDSSQLPPYRFDWDKETQGWIHSSLFIGYYLALLPSGVLASRYGGKRVSVLGLCVGSLAQTLTPWAATMGIHWLCVVRALCGLGSGFIYAPVFGVLANWVPRSESSLLFGLAGAGMEGGAVVSFFLSSLVCESDVIGGWPIAYYVTGGTGLVTTFLLYCLMSDLPSQNRFVSRKERRYIETVIGQAGGHGHKDKNDNSPLTDKIPVSRILKSLPVWAIIVSQIGSDWLYYLYITVMPNFMEEVLLMSNSTITLVTGLPFLIVMPTIYGAGAFADFLRRRHILSTTAVRKLGDFMCKILSGCLLVGIGFLSPGQDVEFSILYAFACIQLTFCYVSWITNPVDLSPVYTGFITSLSETGAMWIGMVLPVILEYITKDKLASQWRTVFFISAGLQVVSFLFYLVFGSSELQPWGSPDGTDAVTKIVGDVKYESLPSSSIETGGVERHSAPWRSTSDSLHRPRFFRSITPLLSDSENDYASICDLANSQRPKMVTNDVDQRKESRKEPRITANNIDPHMTSDSNADYVTMQGRGSMVVGDATDDEGLYESMNVDEVDPNSLVTSPKQAAVYENVFLRGESEQRESIIGQPKRE